MFYKNICESSPSIGFESEIDTEENFLKCHFQCSHDSENAGEIGDFPGHSVYFIENELLYGQVREQYIGGRCNCLKGAMIVPMKDVWTLDLKGAIIDCANEGSLDVLIL